MSKLGQWSFVETENMYFGAQKNKVVEDLPSGLYLMKLDDYNNVLAVVKDQRPEKMYDLDNEASRTTLDEVKSFWSSAKKYKELGVTHKRGIMLYGPPGCGKTSAVSLAISETVRSGGIATIIECGRDLGNFTESLPKLRQIEPSRPVLCILEDFDNLANQYEFQILELLDGTTSVGDGVLFVCTTNNHERIPARIRCRPSRIDTSIYFGLPDYNCRADYLSHLFDSMYINSKEREPVGLIHEIAVATEGLSLAHVKEAVIGVVIHGKDLKSVIKQMSPEKERVTGDAKIESLSKATAAFDDNPADDFDTSEVEELTPCSKS